MRTLWRSAVVMLGFGLSGTLHAQTTPFFKSSAEPAQFTVVGPNPNKSIGGLQNLTTPTSSDRFFNNSVGTISNKSVIARSNFPTYGQLPNEDYFAPFRIQLPAKAAVVDLHLAVAVMSH